MQTTLLLSLQITLLGMGLVFLAIVLLWGMMALLVALTRAREEAAPAAPAAASEAAAALAKSQADTRLLRARAAAAAVAIALAEQSLSTAHPLAEPPTSIVSAWQLGMRSRQMYEKGHR